MIPRSVILEPCFRGQCESCPGGEEDYICSCLCHERDPITEAKQYAEHQDT